MGFHVISWDFMGFHGISWIFMDLHGSSWVFMGFHGISWVFMGLHGISCDVLCVFSACFDHIDFCDFANFFLCTISNYHHHFPHGNCGCYGV